MKILWVKSGGLVPLDTGGKIRSFHLVKELARRHEVTLFTFYPEQANDYHHELQSIFSEVVSVPMRLAKRASLADCLDYGLNLFSGRPHVINKYCRPQVAHRLRRHLAHKSYDLIVCDFLATAAVIPWELPLPKIVFTHNVEAMIWQRHVEVSRNPVWKAVSWREYRTMRNMEQHYLLKADHVLTVSEADRSSFSSFLSPEKITVIPTGVDTEYFRPDADLEPRPNSMVFTGSMDWMPNEDSIFHFADRTLPIVRKSIPAPILTVVGRSPSQRLLALAKRTTGIEITGRVEDVRPYVNSASVFIVPLRIGGGTRIKIFEAMASGKAVVSTSIGAEGLPVTPNQNILLADTPEDFAAAVVSLLQNPELRRRLGTQARRMVEKSYSWSEVAGVFDRVCAALRQRNRPERTERRNVSEYSTTKTALGKVTPEQNAVRSR